MTALLYYSISSNLTEDKIIEIDRYVSKNRKFIRNLPSNSKRKAKRLFLYGTFIVQLGQPLAPYAVAVIMPLPPQISIEHLVPAEVLRSNNQCTGIAPTIKAKVDKIRLTNDQIKQFNNLALQLNNGSIKMEEAILQLRGGDGLTDVIAVFAFVIFVNWYDSLFGVKAFQADPLLHQDPVGWCK